MTWPIKAFSLGSSNVFHALRLSALFFAKFEISSLPVLALLTGYALLSGFDSRIFPRFERGDSCSQARLQLQSLAY
ncbi:hypothetical protein COCNU_scaffold006081G000010 [Cocos nucifera]|nr:hypothetical protein [Cocos nucifera]